MTTFKEAFDELQQKSLCKKSIDAAQKRIGEVYFHPKHGEFSIIEYYAHDKVKIRFVKTGYEYFTSYSHIRRLEVCDKYRKGTYGNCRGESCSNKEAYKTWYNMLFRCNNSAGYKGATVCEDWLNYSVFKEWYEKQNKEKGWHLDKDILSNGNGLYSPATCCFLPPEINTFFVKHKKAKGYSFNKKRKKYEAYCRDNGKYVHLGMYSTPIEAREAYVAYKREVFSRVISPYKDKISITVYESMLKYLW